ncbi:uncharacterized protein M6B38_411665 [Iris pallida]|uniref:Uncharacterized protein n=1 Tax=Iris pallida TaxID=29817 RepID=A0AAX6FLQ0_IRIPA|nr:uncharacterized protein M6B38_411665 [Iris pallida]
MDDFSFPTISTDQDSPCQLTFPHFAASPLWFLSSVNDNTDCQPRRSSSEGEEAANIIDMLNSVPPSNDDDEEGVCSNEEKMDMLWEAFNEELRRVSFELKRDTTGDRQAYGVAKGGGGSLFDYRRPSMMMLLKMLKKLFFLQKTSFTRASLFQKLQSRREQ